MPTPQATPPQALVKCMLEGDLVRSVTDATCEAMGVGRAECEQAHAQTNAMLRR